ncbi:MAG: DUF1573 domain-containing protein [Bacteroidales bacterium]|nr:DUF1573 domain-containing protein [Bacteroidales bacterium]
MRNFGKIIAVLMLVAVSGALGQAWAQTGHTTSLKFDKVVHNFGKILAGSGAKKCDFKYTNVSSEPVVINNILSSCGCSVPEWNKAPIRPGESGVITVTFLNDQGAYPFDKTLTVYVSSSPKPIQLRITGVAYDKEKPVSELYPAHFGPLGMKAQTQNAGQIEQGLKKALKENVVNISKKKISVSFENVDPALSISISPSVVKPGESATISYTINTATGKQRWGNNLYKATILCDGAKAGEFSAEAMVITPYTGLSKEQKANAPQILLDKSSINFGSAGYFSNIPVAVTISNPGKTDLKIYKVETGGVKMKIDCPSTIKAGGKGKFHAYIRPNKVGEDIVFVITLITNSPDRPLVTIFASGTVWPER